MELFEFTLRCRCNLGPASGPSEAASDLDDKHGPRVVKPPRENIAPPRPQGPDSPCQPGRGWAIYGKSTTGGPRPTMRSPKLHITILALAAALLAAPAQAGRPAQPAHPNQADCQQLMELYRACHRLGQQSGSVLTCEESAGDYVLRLATRAGKPTASARALAELVCSTGCEDAAANRPLATTLEFSEAFCDSAPATKAQGGRP